MIADQNFYAACFTILILRLRLRPTAKGRSFSGPNIRLRPKVKIAPTVQHWLISKCPFGFIVWTKLPTKLFLNFCPEIFCTFLVASWKLFGASCRLPCLWYYILSPQEAQRASMKPPRKLQKTSGQKSRNNFVGIFVQTMKPKRHFEINWPLQMIAVKNRHLSPAILKQLK